TSPIGEGMEAVFSAADDGGHAQHASVIGAGELVLEVARDHVADLSERVRCLFLGVGGVPQHALGNLPGGFCVAADRQNSAQRPAKPTMAVNSSFGLFSDGAATFTRQPTIISKTSSTASSIMGSQFSSCESETS